VWDVWDSSHTDFGPVLSFIPSAHPVFSQSICSYPLQIMSLIQNQDDFVYVKIATWVMGQGTLTHDPRQGHGSVGRMGHFFGWVNSRGPRELTHPKK